MPLAPFGKSLVILMPTGDNPTAANPRSANLVPASSWS